MDLAFPAGLVLAVLLSVLIQARSRATDARTGSKGAQLLAVYLVLALTFFFLPSAASH
jgi:Ca2+:H+ antiporter